MNEVSGFRGRYRFLSNFYVDPVSKASVEAYFQAKKTTDRAIRATIRGLAPGDAKRRGRQIELRPDWEDVKQDVMLGILAKKFTNKPPFYGTNYRSLLLATGDDILIESNVWHDNYWGNCTCPRCAATPGQNHLGLLLMQVRNEITTTIKTKTANRRKRSGI